MSEVPAETLNLVSNALKEQGIYSPNVLAYALATMKAEVGNKYLPIREIGGASQARKLGYSGGENYYGRGYIQLTHDYNYKDMGKKLGLGDALVNNPDLALRPDIAAKILAVFFKERGVAQAAEKGDFVGARKGVNGTDRAQEIAGYAQNFLKETGSSSGQPAVKGAQANQPKNVWENFFPNLMSKLVPNVQASAAELEPNLGGQGGSLYSATPQSNYIQPKTLTGAMSSQSNMSSSNPYTVQAGDTLWDIAEKYLGSGALYPQLGYKGNPNTMPVGTKLNVSGSSQPAPNMSTVKGAVYAPPPLQYQTLLSKPKPNMSTNKGSVYTPSPAVKKVQPNFSLYPGGSSAMLR